MNAFGCFELKARRSVPLLFLAATLVFPASAQQAEESTAGQTTRSVELELQEMKGSVLNYGLGFRKQIGPFKKEPALGQQTLVRGFLCFGGKSARELPFLWTPQRGELHLDLNSNQDFTDDVSAVYQAVNRRPYAQGFTNISIPFPVGGTQLVLICNLDLYQAGTGSAHLSVSTRSYWGGKFALDGQEWQVGIVPNPSLAHFMDQGSLLLRPWSERDEPFDPLTSCCCIPWTEEVFFGGNAYSVKYGLAPWTGNANCRLELTQKTAVTGELKLIGQFIRGLVLFSSGRAAILNSPGTVVTIPVGSYTSYRISLKAGGSEAFLPDGFYAQSNLVEVNSARQASLVLGGPLTNSVSLSQYGRNLNLTYRLLGADGRGYKMAGPQQKPEFVAYRNGKKVGSGTFEFG